VCQARQPLGGNLNKRAQKRRELRFRQGRSSLRRVVRGLLRFARNDTGRRLVIARSRRRRGNLTPYESASLDLFSKVITNSMRRRSFRMHGPCHFECIVPVISSEARNPGQKTKISQSQPLTSFGTRSFEMTKVDLWRLSGGGRKRPHARLGCPDSDRNFEKPYSPYQTCFTFGKPCNARDYESDMKRERFLSLCLKFVGRPQRIEY
jgi:hypothetical protein